VRAALRAARAYPTIGRAIALTFGLRALPLSHVADNESFAVWYRPSYGVPDKQEE
jgi:hypothetical protein